MNADHKIGRSEALRDVSRLLHEQLTSLSSRIEERSRILSSDPALEGYVSDDIKLNELRAMRTALDVVHSKVVEL
jgi:hypothetical protein